MLYMDLRIDGYADEKTVYAQQCPKMLWISWWHWIILVVRYLLWCILNDIMDESIHFHYEQEAESWFLCIYVCCEIKLEYTHGSIHRTCSYYGHTFVLEKITAMPSRLRTLNSNRMAQIKSLEFPFANKKRWIVCNNYLQDTLIYQHDRQNKQSSKPHNGKESACSRSKTSEINDSGGGQK